MQLFCINSKGWEETQTPLFGFIKRKNKDCKGPHYGDIVTKADYYWDDGVLYYKLIEWPDYRGDCGFEANQFIPLSNIDETEMVREHQTEKV